MNTRTTIVLAVCLLAALGGWLLFLFLRPGTPASETLAFLDGLDPKKVERVEIYKADKPLVSLTRSGASWQLPGNWPIREQEVQDLVERLTRMGSRFSAIRLPDARDEADKALQRYGLSKPGMKVTLRLDGKDHALTLGEAADDGKNRFTRPTYLRLDDKNEVVRLGPGLIAQLDFPQDYYQKRQLFLTERAAEDEKSSVKVERLLAKEIALAGPEEGVVQLVKVGDGWELRGPRERVDADRVKSLLKKAVDVWAESFADPEAIKSRFGAFPAPVTGVAPGLAKRDFRTSQTLWAAAQSALFGSDALGAGALAPALAANDAFLLSQALPAYTLRITTPDGLTRALHVGALVPEEEGRRRRDELRYARLEDPSGGKSMAEMTLFEVKGDLVSGLPMELHALRDAALIRFKSEEARRVEVQQRRADGKADAYDSVVVLARSSSETKEDKAEKKKEDDPFHKFLKKDKKEEKKEGAWRMEQPSAQAVEREPIDALLDQLSGLRSERDDTFYPAEGDLARYGLDKPAYKLKLVYEEEAKDEKKKDKAKKEAKRHEIVLHVGSAIKGKAKEAKKKEVDDDPLSKLLKKDKKEPEKEEKEEGKVYVRVEGWPRVSAVPEKLLELVSRPAHAYRSRQVLEIAADDIGRVEIARAKDAFVLARDKDGWKLDAPVKADADKSRVEQLLAEVSKLAAAEFVADSPSKEDLEKKYGLAPPQVSVTFHLEAKAPMETKEDKKDDSKKEEKKVEARKTHVLHLGKQRPDRPDFYARIDDGPVFVLKKDVADELLRDSLAYRDLAVWRLAVDDVKEIDVKGKDAAYRLIKEDKGWKIAGPIDAPASKEAGFFVMSLVKLRGERFIDHAAKDPAKFGLKTPAMKLTVRLADKKERSLLVGDLVDPKNKERYAQVEGDGGVFVLEEGLPIFERTAYDWLDRVLLTVKGFEIQSIQAEGKATYKLVKKSGEWHVTMSPAPTFTAEEAPMQEALRPWTSLQAERIAATGKIDWTKYGLDKPYLTLTLTRDLPDGKPIQHTLALGGDAGKGERFARMDKGEFVAVLGEDVVKALDKTHVDFLPRDVLKFTITDLTGLTRIGSGDVSIVKRGDSWHLDKPYDRPADDLAVGEIIDRTFRLKAARIVEFPAKNLAAFGLDKPVAAWKFILTDPTGAPSEETLLIGGPAAKDDSGQHYAMKAKDDKVFVLPGGLARTLLGKPLSFADRNVTTFTRADQAVQERGTRKTVFLKSGPAWTMTGPVEAKAEDAELENFVRDLSRLRIGEVVEAKTTDLKKFDLEKPEATWTLRLGDKQVLKLLVGGMESAKTKEPRRYARIEGNDMVFLLTPKMSQEALGEYRERKVFAGLDPIAVEELRYQTPGGPIRLRKSDTRWSLLDDPDKKVNSKTVTDVLSALAALKVDRFLTDTKDAEKEALAQLQKPEYVIEAQAEKQLFRLLLGGKVAGSEGRYARRGDSEAIFILSAAEVERILKTAAAFVAEEKRAEK